MKIKIFWLILVLAFFLRFYKLGEVPISLDWDENSNAYNAYSILKTGRDQYSNFLPLTNRSFDDYKPPLYMYLNIPSVVIFGLTPFAARLPSAIFGFLTVPLVYLLTKKLFEKENIALLAAFFLAISPWHLQFSRVGFEANVGLFFAVAAATFLLYALFSKQENGNLKKSFLWAISAIFFGISLYSYHAQRVFLPILFLTFAIIWRREIFSQHKNNLVIFLFICTLFTYPLILSLPKEVITQRFATTTQASIVKDLDMSVNRKKGSAIFRIEPPAGKLHSVQAFPGDASESQRRFPRWPD